jgi:hypothetical protein
MVPDEIFPDTWKNTIVADVDHGKIGWEVPRIAVVSRNKAKCLQRLRTVVLYPNHKGELSSRLLSP